MRPAQLRSLVLDAVDEAKAREVTVLDMRRIAVFTDYMVIATGTSNRHVAAVADHVMERLAEQGQRPNGVEGMEAGDWVLLDYGDLVLHVMRAQTRDFYNLEKLWSEARRV